MEAEDKEEEAPLLFRCPISMELMENPVTVATGVTYERKNIEKWLYTCKKSTCPATMQTLSTFDLTPNNTLKSLIQSWHHHHQQQPIPSISPAEHDNLVSLLTTIESTPFKVSSLKKLHSVIETSNEAQSDFIRSGGIQALAQIMTQVLAEEADFAAFRACEESLAVLRRLPLQSDKASAELLSKPECMNPMMHVLQSGSAEARLHTMTVLQKLSATSKDWIMSAVDQEIDVVKSLLELLSDEVSPRLSSCSLDVLIDVVASSKRNRHRAIEAGAVCVLIELLSDATNNNNNRHKCEKILSLLKKLCESPEGRSAFTDHGLGVAAVSNKILRVSDLATKLGVKILWLVCSFAPKEKVIEDMMVFGAVRKLTGLLHVDRRSSTKEKAVRMLKMHGGAWRQYPCFPCEPRST